MSKIKEFQQPLRDQTIPQNNHLSWFYLGFLLVFAVISITICSKSSPVYSLNNWDDANCFFTVGKSVANGKVMYRDIFEQKGPLLYFIYSLAYLISNHTFFGAYLIEIAFCFLFLYYSAKTLLLFVDKKAIFFLPIAGAVIYASPAFEQGGSAEELCLPCIAFGLYVGLKAIVYDKPIRYREWLAIGIVSGVVLWIKFSLLGFFVGFGLYMMVLYLRRKWFARLWKSLLCLLAGEVIAALPIFIYFIANDALPYLFDVYFYCNIFYYPTTITNNKLLDLVLNLFIGMGSFFYNFWMGVVFIVMGLIFTFQRSRKLFQFYLLTLIFSFLLVYGGGRYYTYYCLILAAFLPVAIALIYKLIQFIFPFLRHLARPFVEIFAGIILTVCVGMMYLNSPNTYMIWYTEEQLPQYMFAQIISQKKDAVVINYGFLDGGFYTASDLVPEYRFFCELNIDLSVEEQEEYVRDKKADFIITKDKKPLLEGYEVVLSAKFESRKDDFHMFHLYRKKAEEYERDAERITAEESSAAKPPPLFWELQKEKEKKKKQQGSGVV